MSSEICRNLDAYVTKRKSRRQFIQAMSVLGISPLAAETLIAHMQQDGVATSARVPGGVGTSGTAPAGADPVHEDGEFQIMEGTGGALLVAQLHAAGVKYVLFSSGSGNSGILDALVDRPDMEAVVLPFEGQGVAAAQGLAMATGKVSFFLCASQGIENMMLNLNNCLTDQVPIIVATPGGDYNVLEPYTAWRGNLTSPDAAPETVRRAMKFAVTPPGAPVALNVGGSAQTRKGKAPVFKMDAVKERPIFRAPADAVEKMARGLIEAKSPAFLVGREVTRGGSVEAMVKLAEKLSIPVFQSQRKDNLYCDFPTDHPLFMENFLAPVRFPPVIDMFVNLGAARQGNDPTAGGDGEDFGRGAPPAVDSKLKYVHVSFNANQIEGSLGGYEPILADVPSTIQDLSNAIDGLLTKDRMDRMRQERLQVVKGYHEQRKKARETILQAVFDEAPISWERVGYELERGLDKNAVIVPELGSQDQKVHQFLTCGPNAKTRFGRTIGGQLGWGLAAAFGVQLGMPDRQVCTILGDGGFLFGQSQGLWSLSRYSAPILVVIMNNHSYNEIRVRNMVTTVGGRQFETGHELVSYLGDPDVDFAKLAEAFGIKGEKVRHPKDLAAAIQRGTKVMRDGRPYMLDVEVGSEGIMADSKWHPPFTIAGLRKA